MSAELFDIVSNAMRALDPNARHERVRNTFHGAPTTGVQEFKLDSFGWILDVAYRATFEPEPVVTITSVEIISGSRRFALPLTAIPGDELAEMEGEIQVELMDAQ